MYLKEKLKFNFEVVHVIFIKLKLSSKLLLIQEIVFNFWSIYTVLKAGEDHQFSTRITEIPLDERISNDN